MTAQEITIKHDHAYLDTLTVGELEDILARAETAIHSIRLELRERQADTEHQMTDDEVAALMPESNLTQAAGQWRDLVQFLKDFTTERTATSAK